MASDPNDDNPIEEILLTGFPNPERIGCPPPSVIEDLGEGRIGREHDVWQHVWSCSPCFRDFKTIRDARWAREKEEEAGLRRRKLWGWLVLGGLLICGAVALGIFWSPHRAVSIVPISLADRGVTDQTGHLLATLPRKIDELHLTLQPNSVPGRYVVAIVSSMTERTAVAIGAGVTREVAGHLELTIVLDLSTAASGRYYLAAREQQQAPDEDTFFPVLVTDAGGT